MYEKYIDSLRQVTSAKRLDSLKTILSELLDDTVDYDSLYDLESDRLYEIFKSLSSGQSIIVMVLTQVVAYIRPDSIILYDEPELHLHPDAINALLRAFHKLLVSFDSLCHRRDAFPNSSARNTIEVR
jgi:predicted ATP-dependent endonuclease of OLD family